MNAWVKIYEFFDKSMTEPTSYGWFHLMFVAIVISASVFLCVRFRDCSDKVLRRIALVCWITFLVLEIYKQIIFGLNYENGAFSWDYEWYAFPYQLCSTPMYALPFIIFLPDGKVRSAFKMYMTVFSLFGGLAVFFYPEQVFIETIGINLQTMIHHGMQIVLAVFLVAHERRRYGFKRYLGSIPVFMLYLAIAMIVNIAVYHVFKANGIDDTFNMFYISPYFDCTLPILSSIYPLVPYVIFFFIYSLGFILISLILYYAECGIIHLATRRKNA